MTAVLGAAGMAVAVALARRARRAAVPLRRSGGGHRRWEGGPGPVTLPAGIRDRLTVALDRAGVTISPEDAALVVVSALVVGAGVGSLFGPGGSVVLGLAPLGTAPVLGRALRHRHRRAVATAMPGLLEQVARELRAGGTVATAVGRTAGGGGVVGAEMARVAGRLPLGLSLDEALAAWGAEAQQEPDGEPVAATAAALGVATRVGGRAADALDGLAGALRDRFDVAAEARAQAVQGRWSAAVVAGLPVVSLAGSVASGGNAPDVLLGTRAGRLALVTGLGLDALAVWWMHRITRVEV